MKMLEGNPGKRTLPVNEIKPAPIAPERPDWLHPYAKEEWERVGPILERMGLLTQIDQAAFSGYCQAYARWREAEENLSKAKNGGVYKSGKNKFQLPVPYVTMAQKNLVLMGTYLGKFGLSPSDRAGLVANKETDKDEDRMDQILKKGDKGAKAEY